MGGVCFLFPIVGIILYFLWHSTMPQKAKSAGLISLISFIPAIFVCVLSIPIGVTMFNTQAYNANKSVIASEATSYATSVIQWWKTPVEQGGGGQVSKNIDSELISSFIGLPMTTDAGSFILREVDNRKGSETATIVGIGKEKKGGEFPKVVVVIDLRTGNVSTTPSTAKSSTHW